MVRVNILSSVLFALTLTLSPTATHAAAVAAAAPIGQASSNDDTAVICTNDDGNKVCYPRVFEPSTEFRTILPGQHVPEGLHIQIDMETGERLAKLIQDPPADPTASLAADLRPHVSRILSSHSHIEGALSGLEDLVHDSKRANQVAASHAIVSRLVELCDPDRTRDEGVRASAAVVIGSMAQNNRSVQDKLRGTAAIPDLLAALRAETDQVAVSKKLYALSAMVRGHEEALARFVDLGGLASVLALVGGGRREVIQGELAKVRVRAARFVRDLFDPDINSGVEDSLKGDGAGRVADACSTLMAAVAEGKDGRSPRPVYPWVEEYLDTLQSLKSWYPTYC